MEEQLNNQKEKAVNGFIPGHKTNQKITVEDIKEALINSGGFVTHAAKRLNVIPNTIYTYIKKYPEIKTLLEDIRNEVDEDLLDRSVFVLKYCLSRVEEDKRIALDAAKYMLDKKGNRRGYNVKKEEDPNTSLSINKLEDVMGYLKSLQDESKSLKSQTDLNRDEINLSNET